ncbi:alpha/beta fold hydrolase [Solirubrobacter sp. CPCC 204708]|uniref:Alpha/beta fold hydrolase n=1 Tax=Solirubrobacter deserti TaxID=2282478 RepID=A0ABT4RLT9_9ACTN|nr:alpha/beta fold hydrolase [Solirubrobacter deserti]MBE2318979.1 alpha/beta fold hydrolase [Solirubrobacter deserti]MDA0139296.1 alpha/beta fold hydrolase [Solirubrobacter deserti]
MLAPGYGNAASAFAVETVPKNWVQYLGEHGYDVWLLDYRASPVLDASRTQFTVDDIATRDWPAAVDTVREKTGQSDVQVFGHCVGGLSLFMAMGAGMEGVRSATFSSLAGNPIPTPGNQLRAHARMATLFKLLGIKFLDVAYDPKRWDGKLIETVMKAVPFRHVYDNPIARRIYFIYGDVYDYENINRPTMEQAVPGFFGGGNLTFFEHISLMIRASEARDAHGQDTYWRNLENFKVPIHFITGEHNKMFVPRGLQRSYDGLRKAHGPKLYSHHVIKDYAHLDLWLGENAERDVWPTALAELEKRN